jgi:hypothetical protein
METSVPVAPVPMRETFCGLLLALSTKLSVAERVPVAVGLKMIEAVQLAPGASVLGFIGQVEVTGKSLRLLLTLLMLKDVD